MKSLIAIFSEKDVVPWKYIIGIFLLLFIFLVFPGTRAWFLSHQIGWIYIFLFAFLVSYLCVPVVRKIALKLNIVDIPEERKMHEVSIPLLGGVAVYVAFAGTVIYNDAFSLELKGVSIGATIVFVLGLIDDFKRVPAKLKLFVQMIAVAIMIHYDVVAHFLPDVWWGKLFEVLITFM